MGTTRGRHSADFKPKAVQMVTEKGLTDSQVARDLRIERSLLAKQKRELTADPDHAFPGKGCPKSMEKEHRLLRSELEFVLQERDSFKKATAFFAKHSR